MAVRFITVAQVRAYSGVTDTLVSDADLTEIIEDIEYQIEKFLNSNLVPATTIESQTGNGKTTTFTSRAPLLALLSLTVNDTVIGLDTTDWDVSGRIKLLSGSDRAIFPRDKTNKVWIKYIHGRLEWDKLVATDTTSDSVAGTSIALAVSSETGFSTNDYVEISSFDGNKEVAKVTGTSSNTITVDNLTLTHLSGATVRRYQIDSTITRFMKIWASIAAISRVVGESFDEITGYTMGEFQVQKGEPYTQWREAIVRLEQQAKEIQQRLRPTPGILV